MVIGPKRLQYPEIGETIRVRSSWIHGENSLRSLWVDSPSADFDIDWDDLYRPPEGADQHEPHKYESIFFKEGRICSEEWWCWRLDHDELLGGPFPQGPIEDWTIGQTQSLTINREGDLIWRRTVLQGFDDYGAVIDYPPVVVSSWTCKATKVDD